MTTDRDDRREAMEDRDEKGGGEGEESFAELLARSEGEAGRLRPGQKVRGTVVKVTAEWIFMDLGRKGEGVLDRKEFADAEGVLSVREGDKIEAYFVSSQGTDLRFTTKIGGGAAGVAQIEEAWRNGIPIEGYVSREIKGGYEVKIGGAIRAFCPHSQMELPRTRGAEPAVGKHLTFKVMEFKERGRNIVISRRDILEEQARAEKDSLKATLREGMTLKGTVTSVRDFGAFVRAGGIEGLVPASEIGWTRVEDARDAVSPGQEVEVVVLRLDWEKDRFSFSMRKAQPDPWTEAGSLFPVGSVHAGRVARLSPFGAFVSLGKGVDGLLHVSKLGGGKRLKHPGEVLKEGDRIEVRVESVDPARKRISLAPAEAPPSEGGAEEEEFAGYAEPGEREIGSLGEILRDSLSAKPRRRGGPDRRR